MRKSTKMVKKLLALFLVVLISIESFGAVVSDNDGSAFITKAEFEALKSNFNDQIENYNRSIDNKIDGAIASYLAGIKLSQRYQCDLIKTKFTYPLAILDDNFDYVQDHLDDNRLIYQPEERYLLTNSTSGWGPTIEGGRRNTALWRGIATIPEQRPSGKTSTYMINISTWSNAEGIVSGEMKDYKSSITMDINCGAIYTYVDEAGRGFALSFDSYPPTSYTRLGPYESHTRPDIFNSYSQWFYPFKFNDDDEQYLNFRYWFTWPVSQRYDEQTFLSIEDWYGGSQYHRLFHSRIIPNDYKEFLLVTEDATSKTTDLSVIANNDDIFLPVVYDTHIKLSNHKDWRQFCRLNRNASYYNYHLYGSSETKSMEEEKTGVHPNYSASFQTIATAGWGATAEGKVAGKEWSDFSVVKAEHLSYEAVDPTDNKTYKYKMAQGIPLWHANKSITGILTIELNSFDDTVATPKLYVSKGAFTSNDPSSFTNLYKVSRTSSNFTDNYVALEQGKNVIYVDDIKKGDVIYYKVIHNSDEEISIKSQPEMEYVDT